MCVMFFLISLFSLGPKGKVKDTGGSRIGFTTPASAVDGPSLHWHKEGLSRNVTNPMFIFTDRMQAHYLLLIPPDLLGLLKMTFGDYLVSRENKD